MELSEAHDLVFRLSQIHRQCMPAHVYVLGTGTYIVLARMWGETLAIVSADMLPIIEERLTREKMINEAQQAHPSND